MSDELEQITYPHPKTGNECRCPDRGHDGRMRTCKRRGCPRCGPLWAMDWRRVMALNLKFKGRPVVMLSITAPGEDQLPWDTQHCAHRRPHQHRGPAGCRVRQRQAREWSDTATLRWAWLRDAARKATKRELGEVPTLLLRVWEPQKRGVPHLHVVLAYGTFAEIQAAHCFAAELKRLAPTYSFGYVDARADPDQPYGVRLKPVEGQEAARYLSSYLTGRNSKKKRSIRENIADPVMPISLIWLTPKLTRVTFATMRILRRARHLWAATEGRCELPAWRDMADAIKTIAVFLQAYRNRPPPGDLTPALELGAQVERRSLDLHGWTGTWVDRSKELTQFAFKLAAVTDPLEAIAA